MAGKTKPDDALTRRSVLIGSLLLLAGCTTASETLELRPSVTAPPPLTSDKYSTIVVDGNTGRVLHEVDSGSPRHPASLTKMMTLYMLFEAKKAGKVSSATQIPVSDHARKQPPSKLGLRAGETIDVDTAIRALAVKSANDVAAAVGEYLGGSEERFAAMMTARAHALGMRSTTFRNASGLPDPEQITTARDMATLGILLRRNFPADYAYFNRQTFEFRGRTVRGHNDLIGRVEGVDGIKTGYIRASGFNIVTAAQRGNRRIIVVVMGGRTARERNDHVEQLVERYLPRSGFGF